MDLPNDKRVETRRYEVKYHVIIKRDVKKHKYLSVATETFYA